MGLLCALAAAAMMSGCLSSSPDAASASEQETLVIRTAWSPLSPPLTGAPTAGQNETIYLYPSDDIRAIVAGATEGQHFIFTPGLYRNLTLAPRNGQSFEGQNGAVLSGAVDIRGWHAVDGLWAAGGFPPPQYSHGPGRNGMAQYREDLVVDGTPWQRVASKAELAPGKFYYENATAYVSVDLSGRQTSALATAMAIDGGSAQNVTLTKLVIRNYASMAQHGAIEAQGTRGWTLVDLSVEGNHGEGLAAGSDMTVDGGSYSNNGQGGIRAQDVTNLTITGVRALSNNYAGFEEGWDAGGIKILSSSNISVRNSEIAANSGTGLWFDWDNKNTIISGNYIHHNQKIGIIIEASYDTDIHENIVESNNQSINSVDYWGAEILIQNSSGSSVFKNRIGSESGAGIGLLNDKRDPGIYGQHVTSGNQVTNNIIVMIGCGENGLHASANMDIVHGTSNIFNHNVYYARNKACLQFTWDGRWFTANEIASSLMESQGVFNIVTDPTIYLTGGFSQR